MSRATLLPLLSLLLALAIVPNSIVAMYPEQAGQIDWHLSHLGPIDSHLFGPSSSSLVVRSSGVLGSIGLDQTGELRWRQILPNNETIFTLTSYTDNEVLTLSSAEGTATSMIRLWTSKDGALTWETEMETPIDGQGESDIITVAGDGKKKNIIAMRGKTVVCLSSKGQLVWSWSSPVPLVRLVIAGGGDSVWAISESSIQTLNAKTGELKDDTKDVKFDTKNGQQFVALKALGAFVIVEKDTIRLLASSSSSSKLKESTIPVPKDGVSKIELLRDSIDGTYLLVRSKTNDIVYQIQNDSVKEWIRLPSGVDVAYSFVPSLLVRASIVKGDLLTIESFKEGSSSSSSNTYVNKFPFLGRGGLKTLSVTTNLERKSIRIIVIGEDASLTYFQDSTLQWCREEGLGSLKTLDYVELPANRNDIDDESSGTYPNLFQRFVPQLRTIVENVFGKMDPTSSLKKLQRSVVQLEETMNILMSGGTPGGSNSVEAHLRTSYAKPLASSSSPLEQDHFGFRKLLLCSTQVGKLYGLESESGKIVWSRFLNLPNQVVVVEKKKKLVKQVWKIHVISHHEAVAIVHDDDNDGVTHLIAFNPINGELLEGSSMKVPFHIETSLILPSLHDSHLRRILLVASSSAREIEIFPNTPEVRSLVASKASNIFFYTVQQGDDVEQGLKGFHLSTHDSGKTFQSQSVWSMSFPDRYERISKIGTRPSNEVIQSSVRILGGGDGGYLYKYLNPNLLVVATTRSSLDTKDVETYRVVPSLKRTTDPSVNIYLLDTITGTILDKFVHRGCQGPVTLVQSENTILYHYYNAVTYQYELSSIDLYETRDGTNAASASSSSSNSVVPNGGSIFDGFTLSSLAQIGRTQVEPFNSFIEPSPQTIQQTFTFRSRITSLSVTQTRRGITMKEYLIGLPSGQLYALPRSLVDPRRPIGEPTLQDRMEGLIPYSAEVPIDTMRIVTHGHTIGQLKEITSAHALLESTSIVCAYGIDLFCIRLTPSQTFDLLNEDFNSPFLIATVTLVFVAIFYTRRMARAKELKAAWK